MMAARTAQAVRVPIRCHLGIPDPLEARHARIETLCALASTLARHGLESHSDPIFDYSVDERGTWWCTATAQTIPETWRTHRTRKFSPCRTCGRRGNGVAVTADGPQCRDAAACARAAQRRRTCDDCGYLGTPYNIVRTDAGTHLCKHGCAVTTTTAVMPAKV